MIAHYIKLATRQLQKYKLQTLLSLVGFPISYVCVKPWLEGYIHQVDIPLWLCPAIFLMVALLVALCIGWRVWKTANARPADELCKG